jgi:hypothetical protein
LSLAEGAKEPVQRLVAFACGGAAQVRAADFSGAAFGEVQCPGRDAVGKGAPAGSA